jgi:hypothetical protein
VCAQKLIFVSLLSFLLAACSVFRNDASRESPVPAQEGAKLVVITEKSFWSQGMGFILTIDAIETHVLDQNQYVALYMAPGEHTITGKLAGGTQTTEESVIQISLVIDETVCLYFNFHQPSLEVAYVTVTPIAEEQARELMQDAMLVGDEQALRLTGTGAF